MYDDWFRDLNKIYVKVDGHVHSITKYDDVCLANAIRLVRRRYVEIQSALAVSENRTYTMNCRSF